MKKEITNKPTTKVFLLSCVGQKSDKPTTAKNLYVSEWFKKAWVYCQQRSGLSTETYILSAKHGLLWCEDNVDPYEMCLLDMPVAERRLWAEKVFRLVDTMEKLNGLQIVVLAGEKYREFLVPLLEEAGATVKVPMSGLGIGQQLAYLNKKTRRQTK